MTPKSASFSLRAPLILAFSAAVPLALFAACGTSNPGTPGPDADAADVHFEVQHAEGGLGGPFCNLPGSVVFGSGSMTVVSGGPSAPDLTWMTLPPGFCVHYFAHVGNARQIRFAPGGEAFVASPTTSTTGGGAGGMAGVVVLVDDDFDGYADGDAFAHTDGSMQSLPLFVSGLPSTQGILFVPGYFYYQDHTLILRLPYTAGDRSHHGPGEQVADINVYSSLGHWPKTMDMADDGTIYVGNGGDQGEVCNPLNRPFHGGILKLDGSPNGALVAQGFRNPIAVKCQHGHNLCFASELALDGSNGQEGREKLVPIHSGDDWGYPCCATRNTPYGGVAGNPDCSQVQQENTAFVIAHTPFGFDFEPGSWPAPYTNNILLSLHGAFVTWEGSRVVAIPTDVTGLPIPTSELGGNPPQTFASGWDTGKQNHGRPADVTFAPDGRVFLANDVTGDIVWIAPTTLNGPVPPDAGTDGAAVDGGDGGVADAPDGN